MMTKKSILIILLTLILLLTTSCKKNPTIEEVYPKNDVYYPPKHDKYRRPVIKQI